MNYIPVALPIYWLLAGLLLALVVLIQIEALRFAYLQLGISASAAFLLLLASLLGSYINIPEWEFPEKEIISGREVSFYGMRYVVPVVVDWPSTIIAVNLGGAIIPALLSLYLLAKNSLWVRGSFATLVVAAVCHVLATPVAGLGIAIPTFIPPLVTVASALLISPANAAATAYVARSLGTLIGADLLNIAKVQGLGAPIVSIGGAGTFDGIFVTGILSVLLASLTGRRRI